MVKLSSKTVEEAVSSNRDRTLDGRVSGRDLTSGWPVPQVGAQKV